MDIEYPSKVGFLRPIEGLKMGNLFQEKIEIENQFSEEFNCEENILLTLFSKILVVSDLRQAVVTPHCGLELNFDLKFEVLYAEQVIIKFIQKNIASNKIGFKLFQNHDQSVCFYSSSRAKLQMWIANLAQKINQNGFHSLFRPLKKLGKGNFATVYEVERITDKRKFAVKAFSKQAAFNAKNGKQSLINQLSIMRSLNTETQENVLQLEGVFESDNSIYVVLDLLKGPQLFHKIQQKNGFFSNQEIQSFMEGLLKGLAHLHSKRIMHRDLKPENIMLREGNSMSPVIVDFGLATDSDIDKYLFYRCGTPGYVAPEIIELNESKHIEPECDIFSAGVIFHILLTRKALFEGSKYDEVYKKNKQMKFNLDSGEYSGLSCQAKDLLKKMLVADPKLRIKASQALLSPYFSDRCSLVKPSSPVLTDSSNTFSRKEKIFNF